MTKEDNQRERQNYKNHKSHKSQTRNQRNHDDTTQIQSQNHDPSQSRDHDRSYTQKPRADAKPFLHPGFTYLFVFMTGASVMSLELTASRFLAPYFGTSMIVWANIIGLILLSMSLGYWFGGWFAARNPRADWLFMITLAAGLWTSMLPVFGKFVFQNMSGGVLNTPVMTIVLSFVAILLVFAPPVLILAMVSPLVLHFVSLEGGHTGKIAGNLYAFSTLGSLLGTFGTAFGTIPFWGTRATLLFWSGLLVVLSFIGLILLKSRRSRSLSLIGLILLAPAAAVNWISGSQVQMPGTVYARDTLYQFVRVIRAHDGTTYLVYNEGGGVQSVHRPGDELGPADYYADYLTLPYLTANFPPSASSPGSVVSTQPTQPTQPTSSTRVLVLGAAAGTIPNLLSHYDRPQFPNLNITGVEIDPAVIPLAYQYFGLKKQDATMVNQDARVFVRSDHEKYNIIIVDAYSQQIYIPFHLTTVEFFQELEQRLTPAGIVALNVNAVSPSSKLLLAMEKTVHTVFPYTYIMKARGLYNYVLLGSLHPITLQNLNHIRPDSPLSPIAAEWRSGFRPIQSKNLVGVKPLTDDLAPVEMMTDQMVLGFIKTGQRP